jgi:hypothetical protein
MSQFFVFLVHYKNIILLAESIKPYVSNVAGILTRYIFTFKKVPTHDAKLRATLLSIAPCIHLARNRLSATLQN